MVPKNCIISQEIEKILKKKLILELIAEKGDFLSSVFLRIKKKMELQDDFES